MLRRHTWPDAGQLAAVTRVMEGADTSREYLTARYAEAHRVVVASQTYNSLLRTLAGLAERMQHSQLASAVAGRLYTLISPVAEPTLERIVASPLYKELVAHLTPVEEPRPAGPRLDRIQQPAQSSLLALPACAAC